MATTQLTLNFDAPTISFDDWPDASFAAWLGGFFDGEGCIYLPPRTGVQITLANTVKDVIFAIQSRLGLGTISETTFTNQTAWATRYDWHVKTYGEAGAFLAFVRPYLTIKAKKADEALLRIDHSQRRFRERYERNRQMIEMVESGMRHKDVAARFNVVRSSVTQVMSAYRRGYTRRKRAHAFNTFNSNYTKLRVQSKTTSRIVSKTKPPSSSS